MMFDRLPWVLVSLRRKRIFLKRCIKRIVIGKSIMWFSVRWNLLKKSVSYTELKKVKFYKMKAERTKIEYTCDKLYLKDGKYRLKRMERKQKILKGEKLRGRSVRCRELWKSRVDWETRLAVEGNQKRKGREERARRVAESFGFPRDREIKFLCLLGSLEID